MLSKLSKILSRGITSSLDLQMHHSRSREILHEELLQNNGISMRTLSNFIHNPEVQQLEHYNKIMGILQEHKGKFSSIEMDFYKLKHVVGYISEDYT